MTELRSMPQSVILGLNQGWMTGALVPSLLLYREDTHTMSWECRIYEVPPASTSTPPATQLALVSRSDWSLDKLLLAHAIPSPREFLRDRLDEFLMRVVGKFPAAELLKRAGDPTALVVGHNGHHIQHQVQRTPAPNTASGAPLSGNFGGSPFTQQAVSDKFTLRSGDYFRAVIRGNGSVVNAFIYQQPGRGASCDYLTRIRQPHANHLVLDLEINGTWRTYTFNNDPGLDGFIRWLQAWPDAFHSIGSPNLQIPNPSALTQSAMAKAYAAAGVGVAPKSKLQDALLDKLAEIDRISATNDKVRKPCSECGGTGEWESPLTGAKTPCSQGCKK